MVGVDAADAGNEELDHQREQLVLLLHVVVVRGAARPCRIGIGHAVGRVAGRRRRRRVSAAVPARRRRRRQRLPPRRRRRRRGIRGVRAARETDESNPDQHTNQRTHGVHDSQISPHPKPVLGGFSTDSRARRCRTRDRRRCARHPHQIHARHQQVVVRDALAVAEEAPGSQRAAGAAREHERHVVVRMHVAARQLVAPQHQRVVEHAAAVGFLGVLQRVRAGS